MPSPLRLSSRATTPLALLDGLPTEELEVRARDLYYRLQVITVTVPPLREREEEDIPLLAQHFLRRFAAKNHRELEGFTEAALGCLPNYSWPGNVRDLEHAVERGVILARGRLLDVANLPEAVTQTEPTPRVVTIPIGMPLDEVEQRLIDETLRQTKGDKELAAKLLGIASRMIYRKLKERDDTQTGETA